MPQEKATTEQAFQYCQNFLGGTWSTVTIEQMCMVPVSGGLSNYLYCCSLPDDVELQSNEPRKVLLRIYGEAHHKHRRTLLIDTVVCTLLSERKMGPRVYGIFPRGRLEEYIQGIALRASELRDPKISKINGGILGELHQLDMPLIKEPIWLFNTMQQHLSDLPTDENKFQTDEDRRIFEELRSVCNFYEEVEELKKLLDTVNSPVCFTHNDFQPGNILRLTSEPDNFTVIDYEYCSYNYRGFDIGNHFCEFMFDYVSATKWPFFKVDFTLYPNRAQQINFLSSYVDAVIAAQELSASQTNGTTNGVHDQETSSSENKINREELINQVMKEANYYALASNLFWTLWAINMAATSSIKFGYMDYARVRLTAYYLIRDMLVNENKMPPQLDEELLRSTKNPFHASYNKQLSE